MIKIDEEKVNLFSNFIKEFNFKFNLLPDVKKAKDLDEARKLLTLYFYVDAICHQTQNFFGEINGKFFKGWDFLLNSFFEEYKKDESFIEVDKMIKIKGEDIKRILNGSGDRYYERAYLIRNCAYVLKRDFKSDIFEIHRKSEGYIKREDGNGIFDLFKKFKAYSDPLGKKTFLFLNIAKKVEFFKIRDPENLWTPVDYHLERTSLRIGFVKVDEKIMKKLILNKNFPQTLDLILRKNIGDAVKTISNLTKIEIEKLDQIFWSLGRSICLKEGPFCDGVENGNTTFEEITGINLKNGCPFSKLCDAYKNFELRKIKESNVKTIFY